MVQAQQEEAQAEAAAPAVGAEAMPLCRASVLRETLLVPVALLLAAMLRSQAERARAHSRGVGVVQAERARAVRRPGPGAAMETRVRGL